MLQSETKPLSRIIQIVFTVAISLLSTIPVWTSKVYYRDDLYRVLDGNTTTWLTNGRPATWLLQSLISFNTTLSDISPLNLIAGILFLSTAAVLYTEKLRLPLAGYWTLIPPLFIILNPFLIQCMLYSYDSMTIMLSYAIALLASLTLMRSGLRQFIFDIALLVLVTSLYQSGLNVYIVSVALLIISGIHQQKLTGMWLTGKIAALFFAVLIYKFLLSALLLPPMDPYSLKHNQLLPFSLDSLPALIESIKGYYALFITAYPRKLVLFVLIPLVLTAAGILIMASRLQYQGRKKVFTLLLLLATLPVALTALPGLSLALAYPVFVPRMLASWGATMLFFFSVCIFAYPAFKRWVAGLSLIVLTYHLALMIACFNAVASSQRYEFSVMEQIKSELYRFPTENIHTMMFIGQLNDMPSVKTSISNFPLINQVRMKMMGESEVWIWQALATNSNTPLKIIPVTEEIRKMIPQHFLSRGPEFDAFIIDSTLVVDFRKSGGVVGY